MKNKGYTLIELLVVISIIGIISLIVLPSIRRIQLTNRYKKFESYSQVIEKAAKAYVDSYKDDIFKEGDINSDDQICNKITLRELINKKLIKDTKINNSSCVKKDTDSYVEVSKYQNKYYYKTLIKCKNDNDVVVYQTPHYQEYDPKICVNFIGEDETPPTINLVKAYKPKEKTYFSKSNLANENETIKVKVYFKDTESGLKIGDHSVQITWDFVGVDNEGNDESVTRTTEHTINIPKPSINEPEIRTEYTSQEEIIIDDYFKNKELNGTLTISIKPINVQDRDGNKAIKGGKNILLTLDNNPPKLQVVGYKWKRENNKDIKPTNGDSSNLQPYENNKWYNGKVLTTVVVIEGGTENNEDMTVSGIDENSITYTTTGSTENVENKAGKYSNIEEEGKSTITYHACDKAGNCINSNEFVVKLDRKNPTCESSGGSSSWKRSLTLKGKCNDEPSNKNIDASGCKEDTIEKTYDTFTKSTQESPGTVYDKAGNSKICDANQTVKIDDIPPTCTNSSTKKINKKTENYGGEWINKGEVTVTGKCSDEHSGCNNDAISKYTTDMNRVVTPGTIYDNVGNKTTCKYDQRVRIDTIAPICTWDPRTTTDKFYNTLAASIVTTTCTDTENGSGCKKTTYTKEIDYFIFDIRGILFSERRSNETATAGEVEDNAGNKTVCPKVRPYKDDDCIYTDGDYRMDYYLDSLRGNRYYVINTLGLRPNFLTELGIVGSALTTWITLGMGGYASLIETAIHAEKIAGYRRYRYEDGQYKLCLDKSLDIMYDEQIGTFNGLKKSLKIVPELKGKYQYKEWPGIEVYTSQGS